MSRKASVPERALSGDVTGLEPVHDVRPKSGSFSSEEGDNTRPKQGKFFSNLSKSLDPAGPPPKKDFLAEYQKYKAKRAYNLHGIVKQETVDLGGLESTKSNQVDSRRLSTGTNLQIDHPDQKTKTLPALHGSRGPPPLVAPRKKSVNIPLLKEPAETGKPASSQVHHETPSYILSAAKKEQQKTETGFKKFSSLTGPAAFRPARNRSASVPRITPAFSDQNGEKEANQNSVDKSLPKEAVPETLKEESAAAATEEDTPSVAEVKEENTHIESQLESALENGDVQAEKEKANCSQDLNKQDQIAAPEVQSVPDNAQSVTEEAQSVPEETKSVPEESKSVTEEAQSLPEEAQSLPEESKSVAEEAKSVPNEVQSLPEEAQSVPEVSKSVTEEAQSLPDEAKSVPEESKSVPEEAQCVPDEAQSVVEEAPSVPKETPSVPDEAKSVPEVTQSMSEGIEGKSLVGDEASSSVDPAGSEIAVKESGDAPTVTEIPENSNVDTVQTEDQLVELKSEFLEKQAVIPETKEEIIETKDRIIESDNLEVNVQTSEVAVHNGIKDEDINKDKQPDITESLTESSGDTHVKHGASSGDAQAAGTTEDIAVQKTVDDNTESSDSSQKLSKMAGLLKSFSEDKTDSLNSDDGDLVGVGEDLQKMNSCIEEISVPQKQEMTPNDLQKLENIEEMRKEMENMVNEFDTYL